MTFFYRKVAPSSQHDVRICRDECALMPMNALAPCVVGGPEATPCLTSLSCSVRWGRGQDEVDGDVGPVPISPLYGSQVLAIFRLLEGRDEEIVELRPGCSLDGQRRLWRLERPLHIDLKVFAEPGELVC